MLSIFIADDNSEIREGLKVLIGQQDNMKVIGEASQAHNLLSTILDVHPNVVLLDWELPGLIIPDIIKLINVISPTTKIISMSCRPESAVNSIKTGVFDFINKCNGPCELLRVLNRME